MQSFASLRSVARRIPPLYWLAGYVRYRAFRRALLAEDAAYALEPVHATPPPMLRYRVHRALDEASYIAVGQAIATTLGEFLERAGVAVDARDVLDFGCGPGRVAQWMKARHPAMRLQGSDIDPEAIAWAKAHLGEVGAFTCNGFEPPLPLAEASLDLVYSVSVFTHLDARLQDAWLAELRRVVRPGGHVLATTHGRATLRSCSPAELDVLARDGIAFRVDHTGRFKLDGLPDFYQTTFHDRGYVARHWSRWFDVVLHADGGLHDHHDLVLLRRRDH